MLSFAQVLVLGQVIVQLDMHVLSVFKLVNLQIVGGYLLMIIYLMKMLELYVVSLLHPQQID